MDWSLWTPKTTPPLVSHKRYSSPVTTLLWTDHCGHRKPLHHWFHTKGILHLSQPCYGLITVDTENHSTTGFTQKVFFTCHNPAMDWSLWTPKTTPPLVSHKRYSSPVTTLLWTDHCGHRKPLHHWFHTKGILHLSQPCYGLITVDTENHSTTGFTQKVFFTCHNPAMDWSLWTPKTTPPLVSHKRYSSPVTTLLWTITVDTKNHSTTGLTQKVDSLPVSTLLWTDHCGHRKPLHHRSHTKARLSACHNPAVDWSLWTPTTSPPLIPCAETFCFLAGWLIWHLHAQLITGNLCSSPHHYCQLEQPPWGISN